ncbi:MAG TPA: hypothetical protein VMH24_02225, partial [Candidatus Sulfotelmatobacter sp.]|nr:hypothetical protein [Candidatus Sulfotelmatobacter sp.]
EATLRTLPAVDPARADAATIAVVLPDRLVVTVVERQPILVWLIGGARYLVDVTGTLFARLDPGAADPGLPTVDDRRADSAGLAVGAALDPSDLGAVRQLAALTPGFLGSQATTLSLAVTDDEGFTLDAGPGLWHAVFGVYTIAVRPPTIVPQQVQCLASLIAGSPQTRVAEASMDVIRLSLGPARCGTYTVRTAHPTASPAPSPSASARP